MSECSCKHCVAACKRYPGWMTVDEAKAAIVAGLANKLMLDYWMAEENVYVLCPAIEGFENQTAPSWPNGKCVFLINERCSIHESGFKPLQCRDTMACQDGVGSDKKDFLKYWDTDEGRKLVKEWQNEQTG